MIYVVNKSTRVADKDLRVMVRAINRQVRDHVAPVWRRKSTPVKFITDEARAPAGSWVIAVLDDADQADVLGWHTEGPDGMVFGRAFAAPVLDHGGMVLLGSLSVSATLSHEVLETFCDPSVSEWCDSGKGFSVALEICDPVEAGSYDVDGVSVSNFVTPAYFDPEAPPRARFDFLGKLTAPFSLDAGGYWVQMADGRTTQRFARNYPAWKKATKRHPVGRGARRTIELTPDQVSKLEAAAVHGAKVFVAAFLGVVTVGAISHTDTSTLRAAVDAGIGAVLGLVSQWAGVPSSLELARKLRAHR